MSYSQETYQKALAVIRSKRENAEKEAALKKAAMFAAHPEIAELDKKITSAAARAAQCSIALDAQGANHAKQEFDRLSAQRSAIYKQYQMDTVSPNYCCPICHDTGFKDGVLCECVQLEARNIEYARLGKEMPLRQSTFDQFDLSYYSDKTTAQGNPREIMSGIVKKCRAYADHFSPEHAGNLLFMGGVGLGKTHLSLAIAGCAIEKGFGVVYASAQNLLNRLEKEHFGRSNSDDTNHICECDLLIMDDLGAEFSTQFTQSALYNIINTRMQCAKPTIISTNLGADELQKRYDARIMSRIIGNFDPYRFAGDDVRQLKRIRTRKNK